MFDQGCELVTLIGRKGKRCMFGGANICSCDHHIAQRVTVRDLIFAIWMPHVEFKDPSICRVKDHLESLVEYLMLSDISKV